MTTKKDKGHDPRFRSAAAWVIQLRTLQALEREVCDLGGTVEAER